MFCSKCGKEIDDSAVVCPICGVATQNFNKNQQPQVIINNTNTNANTNTNTNTNMNANAVYGRAKNKWVALVLCFFFGVLGVHKFYENKVGMGVLYLFTGGLFCIGVIVDFITLLFKPNPYYI